jgi:Tol biopolymer transport system component
LLVVRSASAHEHPYTQVVRFDIISGQESLWMDDPEVDTSVPVWSPDSEMLAVSRRGIHDAPGKQVWLLNPDGSPLQAVTEDPQASHSACRWSPDGRQLLYQRLELGSSSSLPEVVLWKRSGEARVLAEDAFLPAWVK